MKIVCIILARGGSKGLPRKNIRMLAGRPLIAYSIEAAKRSSLINRIVVSTDDNEIRDVALENGAEVPFLRPKKYSEDNSTSEVALKHAAEWLKHKENYIADIVVYLQVTSVFRTKNMIDDCIQVLIDNPIIDSAFIGCHVHKNYWRKKGDTFFRLEDDIPYGQPRQTKEPFFREETGLALATRFEVILSGRRLGDNCQIIQSHSELGFIDIHSEFDLWFAEKIITDKKIFPNEK
jgi:CMP-N,N'-diacetyllegionaminic acid synthase